MSKVIACMNVGGEIDHILPRNLTVLSNSVDEILLVGSNVSPEMLSFMDTIPNIVKVRFQREEKHRHEVEDFNRLTRAAVKRDADWILFVDSDEVLSAALAIDIATKLTIQDMEGIGLWRFWRIWLWRSEQQYRIDQQRFTNYNIHSVLVRSNSHLHWRNPSGSYLRRWIKDELLGQEKMDIQHGREAIDGVEGEIRQAPKYDVLLHYAAVNWRHFIRQRIRYATWERERMPKKTENQIVDWCYQLLDERGAEFTRTPHALLNYSFDVPKVGLS